MVILVDLLLFLNSYSLSVYVDYVNYYLVMFMSNLHLNEPSLTCDVWINKITYLLTLKQMEPELPSDLEEKEIVAREVNDSIKCSS